MSSNNVVVVFDIWSSYAYFRKPYTTTTALTFNFIPRSAIEGVIAAILGISSKDFPSKLGNSRIGLGILNEVHKIPFSTMHTHTDFWDEIRAYIYSTPRITKRNYYARVNMELLVNPKYRVYFSDTKLLKNLEIAIRNHQTVYTPYLGTSTMIANFEYVGTFDYITQHKEIADISTIIPYSVKIPSTVIERDKLYAIEQNIPGRINENRELLSSFSALYSPNAYPIKIRNIEVNTFEHNGMENNFVFLPS
jgi:CRISPR-associated protein Cas5h